MDIGQYTALGDRNMAQKLIQFLIVANGELEVARDNTRLLVVASCVTGQFENFGSEILEDSRKVNGST